MTQLVTTGRWRVAPGEAAAFVSAWSVFAEWTSTMRGAETLSLTRDDGDPTRYVSYGLWESAEAARAWKAEPEFQEQLARVRAHVQELESAELTLVASATAGAHSIVLT